MDRVDNLKSEFNKVFNNPNNPANDNLTTDNISVEQLWFLVKFGKHIRLRCRNNSAFNNFMNSLFAPARFATVEKTSPCRCTNYGKNPPLSHCDKCRGSGINKYPGLRITKGSVNSDDLKDDEDE